MTSLTPIYTDRSRTLEYQECPRARYWMYEHAGRGVVPVRVNIPLSTGAAMHEGLAALISGKDADAAAAAAVADYDSEVLGRGLQVEANEVLEYVYGEQKALVEALVRAYAIYRLPRLLEQYEVLEVEREDVVPLLYSVDGRPLVWMSRADALLRNKENDTLEVMSFKSAARWDTRQESAANHDMQGLSEAFAIEARLKRDIYAIRMEFLLKGDRRENSEGIYAQESPLIRAYKKNLPWPAEPEYAWSYYWHCSAPHPMRKSKWYPTGQCPGDGRKHKISDDFESISVWTEDVLGGVKGWVEKLGENSIQPEAGDALSQQFVIPVPFYRQPEDMKRWYRQVSSQEARVAVNARKVRDARNQEEFEGLLDEHFQMHTRSCDWPTKCPFQDICFGRCPAKTELPDLYQWRMPHHEPELVQLVGADHEVRSGNRVSISA